MGVAQSRAIGQAEQCGSSSEQYLSARQLIRSVNAPPGLGNEVFQAGAGVGVVLAAVEQAKCRRQRSVGASSGMAWPPSERCITQAPM